MRVSAAGNMPLQGLVKPPAKPVVMIIFELCDNSIIYSLMETAKANRLRLDDYLLHLLSILPERAERNKDFEVDDLLPWSEEMKSWFSAV